MHLQAAVRKSLILLRSTAYLGPHNQGSVRPLSIVGSEDGLASIGGWQTQGWQNKTFRLQ